MKSWTRLKKNNNVHQSVKDVKRHNRIHFEVLKKKNNNLSSQVKLLIFQTDFFRVKQTCLRDGLRHSVRVAVGCRSAVLEVAPPILAHLPGDADAGASVGHAGGEVVDAGGFMETCQAPHVVLAAMRVVRTEVLFVFLAHSLDGFLNVPAVRRKHG